MDIRVNQLWRLGDGGVLNTLVYPTKLQHLRVFGIFWLEFYNSKRVTIFVGGEETSLVQAPLALGVRWC